MAQLAAEGTNVIACTYTGEGSERAAKAGAKQTLRFDITDEAAVQDAVKRIIEITGGNLWALVHNAGMVQPGFVEYQLLETYRRVMDVNYFAVVQLTQPFIQMLKRSKGRVIIVSSVDGIASLPGNAPYDGSKYAVEAYADALRVEVSYWDVHVAVVNPATMRTPLALGFFDAHKMAWEMMEKQDPVLQAGTGYTFSGSLGGGEISGRAEIDSAGPTPKASMNARIGGILLQQVPGLRSLYGSSLSGRLDGNLSTNEAGP